jgi:hypothetical protein
MSSGDRVFIKQYLGLTNLVNIMIKQSGNTQLLYFSSRRHRGLSFIDRAHIEFPVPRRSRALRTVVCKQVSNLLHKGRRVVTFK